MDSTPYTPISNWPLLAGSLVGWGLQGALSVQVYSYYKAFPNDPALQKWFVYGLFALEWVHTGCQSVGAFATFTSSSSYAVTLGTQSFVTGTLASTALISATVQTFYARRIMIISERRLRIVAAIIIGLALVQMVSCIASIGLSSLGVSQSQPSIVNQASLTSSHGYSVILTSEAPAIIWLGVSALVDIIIAASMSILLYRSRTMYAHTDVMIGRVMRHVIESGIATAGVAVVAMIFFIIDQIRSNGWTKIGDGAVQGTVEVVPKTFTLSDFPILVLSKLYVNTALLSLNNRAFLKLSQDQDDLPTSRRHGFMASAGTSRLKAARIYTGIRLRDLKAPSTPYSMATSSGHWSTSWDSGSLAVREVDAVPFFPRE